MKTKNAANIVYIVSSRFPYEGEYIEAVFSTLKEAKEYQSSGDAKVIYKWKIGGKCLGVWINGKKV